MRMGMLIQRRKRPRQSDRQDSQRKKERRHPGREPDAFLKSSPPEKDSVVTPGDSRANYSLPATCKLCTPEKIERPVLTVCGIHQKRRSREYSLRCMWYATKSRTSGVNCVAA